MLSKKIALQHLREEAETVGVQVLGLSRFEKEDTIDVISTWIVKLFYVFENLVIVSLIDKGVEFCENGMLSFPDESIENVRISPVSFAIRHCQDYYPAKCLNRMKQLREKRMEVAHTQQRNKEMLITILTTFRTISQWFLEESPSLNQEYEAFGVISAFKKLEKGLELVMSEILESNDENCISPESNENCSFSAADMVCCKCGTQIIKGANFCYNCGLSIEEIKKVMRQRQGEIPLFRYTFHSPASDKVIEVWCRDITTLTENVDILTISSFRGSYNKKSDSVIGALYRNNKIDVSSYVENCFLNLRESIGCWISNPIENTESNHFIKRLGGIEFNGIYSTADEILLRMKEYCALLDLASAAGIKIDTVVIPVLGTGRQKIDIEQILFPMSSEIIAMLKRNPNIHKVLFVERKFEKAKQIVERLNSSYQLISEEKGTTEKKKNTPPFVFISYTTHGDSEIAENIYRILKEKGISCWYAPQSINAGDFAEQIVKALDKCTHFICIISKKSMESHHVLNELNLAFQHLGEGISILPYRVDDEELSPSFKYYLSTMQWHYGYPGSSENMAQEFIEKIFDSSKQG